VKGQSANDQSIRVKKLSAEARLSTRGSAKAAGHHLYTIETSPSQRASNYVNWNSHRGTSQHPWMNCTTKQSSSQKPTRDKCRWNRRRPQGRSQRDPDHPVRPTLPGGKRRPNCTINHPRSQPHGPTRNSPIRQHLKRKQRILALRDHLRQKSQDTVCQTKNGN